MVAFSQQSRIATFALLVTLRVLNDCLSICFRLYEELNLSDSCAVTTLWPEVYKHSNMSYALNKILEKPANLIRSLGDDQSTSI